MKFLILLSLAATVLAKHEDYIGWKSYFVGPASSELTKAFYTITDQYEVDILSPPTVREGVVLVKPEHQEGFTKTLQEMGINFRVHRDDLKAALDVDDERIEKRRMEINIARNGGRQMPYDNYQDLEVFYEYMEDVARRHPETVTLVEAATTFEGRPIKYVKISTTNFQDESKPVIFIDGGIHSREWVAMPPVTYAIHKLVDDVTEPDLLQRFDWILHPMVNPDGYAFSRTSNRWWRKTRSTDQHLLSGLCPGVDGNRNYDFYWDTVGTSPNQPCTDIYAGNRPFSEVETRVVRDIFQEYLHRMPLYLTIHSYGSMILYGWGHDGSLSNNALALHTVGIAMANVIDNMSLPNFPRYIVGNSALVLNYAAAGASEDYAHSIGVPLSYTYELPGLAGSWEGFNLEPQYIEQVCKETWEGFVVGARRAGDLWRR